MIIEEKVADLRNTPPPLLEHERWPKLIWYEKSLRHFKQTHQFICSAGWCVVLVSSHLWTVTIVLWKMLTKRIKVKDPPYKGSPLPEKRLDTWRSDLRSVLKIILNWQNDCSYHFAFNFFICLSSKMQWKISILKERKKIQAQEQCIKKGEFA